MPENREFRPATTVEQFFNRAFGFAVGLGLGPSYAYLLEVKGRKSGKVYSTPVNLHEFAGKEFLVAPRGRTQWVRNAEATGEVTLKRGSYRKRFHLQAIDSPGKLPVLKQYLDQFRSAVQRYFSVPAGSPPEAFAAVADRYPVFELSEIEK